MDEKDKTGVFTGCVRDEPAERQSRSRSSSPTTCSWATAPARSWPCPRATSATTTTRPRSSCRSSTSSRRWARRWDGTGPGTVADGRGLHRRPGSRSTRPTTEVSLDGLGSAEAKERGSRHTCRSKGIGRGTVTYRLRDWLFSRQRYWGEPFPIVFDEDGVAHALPDAMLPLTLPDVPDYSPKTYDPEDAGSEPEPPLSRVADWVDVELDLGDGRGVQTVPPRDQHHAQLGRVVLVLPALPRPGQRRGHGRPGQRALLGGAAGHPRAGGARGDAGPGRRRPLRRRRRARGAAPALCPVLAQGALRPGAPVQRGAVPHLLLAGLHPGAGLHRRARAVCPAKEVD
jgi:hypothetical protein